MTTIKTKCEIKYICNVFEEMFKINNVNKFFKLVWTFIIATPIAYIITLQSDIVGFTCLVFLLLLVYTLAYIKCKQRSKKLIIMDECGVGMNVRNWKV